MNPDPRFHLSGRRPNGQDDEDPPMADALQKAAQDPALAAWAAREKETDAALALKLRSVQPPAGLRDRILAGAQVRRAPVREWFERQRWRSFRNSEVVAAAAIILLFGAALLLRLTSRGSDAPTWQEAAVVEVAAIEQAGGTDPLDLVVSDLPAIRSWLAAETCPPPATLPAPVRQLNIYGCAKRSWRGQPMSIVCFALDRGREVHLVTIHREHLPASPPERVPEFSTVRGYETASWSEGDVAMMLLGKVERAELEALFSPARTAVRRPPPFLLAVHR